MLHSFTVIVIFCIYMGLLFGLALWAERRASAGRSLINNPLIYSLSLAIYCTAWTFYGSVGVAAHSGLLFLAIFLGPTLVIIFWGGLLRKMVRLKNKYRITSIADFISSRYEKSEPVAALVTMIALVGITPYVALQIKAVLSSFTVLTTHQGESGGWLGTHVGPVVVALLIVFTIIFGVRRQDPTERHEGMVLAVAVESMVKLVSFLTVGIFVAYFLFDGVEDLLTRLPRMELPPETSRAHQEPVSFLTWICYLVASAGAILFLPRQVHIAVVENKSERHIRWAMWLFPLYLLAINYFVYPIAAAGLAEGYPLEQADTFMLRLPLDQGSHALALLVFIGGFSAGTSMILISSMTMSTMISNHLLLPLVDWIPQLGIIERQLLKCRWAAVAGFILLGYYFERLVGENFDLVGIGMLSFNAVLQLAPATIGGLYWRGANRKGAIWGMTAGFTVWVYTHLLPAFVISGHLPTDFLEYGPLGIAWLRPQHLFGLEGLDPLAHSVLFSLIFNLGFFIVGSLVSESSPENQRRAEAFVGVLDESDMYQESGEGQATISLLDKRRKIEKLFSRYHQMGRAEEITDACIQQVGLSGSTRATIRQLAELYDQVEKTLGGIIGAATAHRILAQSDIFSPEETRQLRDLYAEILADLRARPADLKRKIDFYRERANLIRAHSAELEDKLNELKRQISRRRQAEGRLRESEERYRLAIEYSSDGVAVINDARIIFCNRRLPAIFGYRRRRDMLGRALADIIHPDDRERVLTYSRQRQRGLTVPNRFDYKGLKKDGNSIYVAVSATSVNYHGQTLELVYLRDVTNRRRTEEEIRHLSRRLIAGIEEERRRLAADLHDEFGQSLTALHLWVESLKKSMSPDQAEQVQRCDKLGTAIEQIVDRMRKVSSELRPDMLDHLGLVPTAEWFVKDFQRYLEGVKLEFEAVGFGMRRLNPELEIGFYRILQEALNNVAKHAAASKVSVRLTYSHPKVIMVIKDDGRGFEPGLVRRPSAEGGGIGLVSMKERVAAVGGTLDIRSSPGSGVMIRVSAPARRPEAPASPETAAAAEG